jgi:hypothetical protein
VASAFELAAMISTQPLQYAGLKASSNAAAEKGW